ncbi:MAG: flippase [Ruminococcaceae bacterium]|nr:flippase [Oscillospiraceae bacterium]
MIKNKIFRNASWIIVCRIVQSVFTLIITMLTARYLGPSNYGLISYAASVVAFVVPVMQLGLGNILVQQTVDYPEEEGKIFGTSAVMSVCSSLACIVGVVSFAAIANKGETDTIIVCGLYSILLVFQAIELIQYWFQAKYLSKFMALISLGAYVVVSAYKIFLLASGKSVYWFAVSNAIDYLLIAVGLHIAYRCLGGAKLEFSWAVAKRMFSSSRHYIVSSLMVTVFAQTDKIMLKLMIDEAATGYYSAAVSCAGITSFVFAAIIDSSRPAIFESKKKDIASFEKNVSRLYCVIIYLSLAQSLGMTLLAKPIIHILYGKAYYPAIAALQVIVWYTTFAYLGSVRNIWILAEQKQKYLWIINLSGALMNVILNACLIPYLGIVGAAIASLITQVFTNIVIGIIIRPIRRNNRLMLSGLNPKNIIELVKNLR